MNIRAIRNLHELADVRAWWEQRQSHINNDLGQFELVCALRPEVESPFVIVIDKDGAPEALLAGRLERCDFSPSIGYARPVRVRARVLAVIHQGVLGTLTNEAAADAIRYLKSLLHSGVADVVAFHHLSEDSSLLRALQLDRSQWLSEKSPRWSTHREMLLSAGGGFLDQKLRAKHRSSIRKRQKELDAAFPGKVAWRWMVEFDDIPALSARLEEVAAKTYQRGLGAGFFDNEDYRRRFELFARRKQLRVQVLEIEGKVRAFWFGTVYAGAFHSSETGYDPELRDFEVGTLMFVRLADQLIQEGVRRVDFGLGDAPYKERFGDRSWRETPAWLFAPTPKGVALMLLIKVSFALDTAARRVVDRMGLTDRIKALWRRRMAKDATKPRQHDLKTGMPDVTIHGARNVK
jgi:CelD/BcsL family acetyltransferase involved in cellulose biosynthesis